MTRTGGNIEIIAEIGQAHDGSLGILYSYIDAFAQTGIDTLKFQIHIADAESSAEEPFRINFSREDDKRIDYWRRMEFSKEQWKGIKEYTESKGLSFLASPFSLAAVELLEEIGVERYKIGSGEVNNFLMLDRIAKTGKPIILSSGMSNYVELKSAVSRIERAHQEISILQCTTSYPTSAEEIGFNVIGELKEMFPKYKIGLSEHTSNPATGIAAASLGAEILEFHVVFDKRLFGPDASSSLTLDETKFMVDSIRFVEKALKNPVDKSDNSRFKSLKNIFEKSLAINKDMPKGSIIKVEDLEAKKPAGHGISASEFERVLGKRLVKDLGKYEFLTLSAIEK